MEVTITRRRIFFMDLPRELRDEVYKHAVKQYCIIDLYQPNASDRHDADESYSESLRLPRRLSSLMLTSKAIMNEALEMYLSIQTFDLTPSLGMRKDYWTTEKWADVVPRWYQRFGDCLRLMRSVRIVQLEHGVDMDFYSANISISWRNGRAEVVREEEFMFWCTCSEEREINSTMASRGFYDGRVLLDVAARLMEQARIDMGELICDGCDRVKLVSIAELRTGGRY